MNPPLVSSEAPSSPVKSLAAVYAIGFGGTALAAGLFYVVARAMQQHHVGRIWFYVGSLAYAAAILAVAYVAMRTGKRLLGVTRTAAARRYQRRFFVAMAAYVIALLTSTNLNVGLHPAPWVVWLLALAPAVAIVATIVVMGLYLREETDELERAIISESALWATGGLLAITTTWGFLEQFGLVVHVEAWAAFPLWALCMGPANALVRRRYS
jgi:hypothetical protein